MSKPGEGIESVDTEGWKRCPFCGGEPRAIAMEAHDSGNDTDWTGIAACHECGVRFVTDAKIHDELIAEMRRLWNARHERTCHMVFDYEDMSFRCDACGSEFGTENSRYGNEWWERGEHVYDGRYCPDCGAKVVDP